MVLASTADNTKKYVLANPDVIRQLKLRDV